MLAISYTDYFTALSILGGGSLALYVVCRLLAWHFILFRNRRRYCEVAPRGTVFRPERPDLQAATALIFVTLFCTGILVFAGSRIDFPLYWEIWSQAFAGTATVAGAGGMGAVTVICLVSLQSVLWSVWKLRQTYWRVRWITPEPETRLSADDGEPPRRPDLQVLK